MKTVAITIDETTLRQTDALVQSSGRLKDRSAVIRAAVREFAEHEYRRQAEKREAEILRTHRARLTRQARSLVAEQAKP